EAPKRRALTSADEEAALRMELAMSGQRINAPPAPPLFTGNAILPDDDGSLASILEGINPIDPDPNVAPQNVIMGNNQEPAQFGEEELINMLGGELEELGDHFANYRTYEFQENEYYNLMQQNNARNAQIDEEE